jgi:hypothetical protein
VETAGTCAWGFVVRSDQGDFLVGKIDRLRSALHAEATSCLTSIEGAADLGANQVI